MDMAVDEDVHDDVLYVRTGRTQRQLGSPRIDRLTGVFDPTAAASACCIVGVPSRGKFCPCMHAFIAKW